MNFSAKVQQESSGLTVSPVDPSVISVCYAKTESKCKANKNQSLTIDMHWMFPHCSDRDASPNIGLKITGRPDCVSWSGETPGRNRGSVC